MRTQSVDHTYSATTGRNNAWTYDADGRMLGDVDTGTGNTYDEAGSLREVSNSSSGTLFTQQNRKPDPSPTYRFNLSLFSRLGPSIKVLRVLKLEIIAEMQPTVCYCGNSLTLRGIILSPQSA